MWGAPDAKQNTDERGIEPKIEKKVKVEPCSMSNEMLSVLEQSEVEVMKKLIHSYFKIVKNNLCDTIPKAIITFLVHEVKINFLIKK